jgi:sugar lactone lactonase YvrE
LALIAIGIGAAARADFIPGHIYVGEPNVDGCFNPFAPNDRVWDVDPVTGQSQVFAEVPDALCGVMRGLTFTPDGSKLRAGIWLGSKVLEIDGSGNVTQVLGSADGIAGPNGSNDLAYAANGDFYVANEFTRNILKFPAAGGPGEVFADLFDGITSGGNLGFAPNGDLYWGEDGGDTILRFDPSGQGQVFGPPLGGIDTLTVSSSGDVYVGIHNGTVARFTAGNPGSLEFLTPPFYSGGFAAMTFSPDESLLYIASLNTVYSVDPGTGGVGVVASVPVFGPWFGTGIAVAVPEPSALALLGPSQLAGVLRRSAPQRGC